MKKFLSAIILLIGFMSFSMPEAEAQFQDAKWSKPTVSGTDTSTGTIAVPFSTVASFTFSATRTSGTHAAKVYIYGYDKSVGEKTLLDSATISGNTTVAYAKWNNTTNSAKFGQLSFYRYQFYVLNTSGAATLEAFATLRSGK